MPQRSIPSPRLVQFYKIGSFIYHISYVSSSSLLESINFCSSFLLESINFWGQPCGAHWGHWAKPFLELFHKNSMWGGTPKYCSTLLKSSPHVHLQNLQNQYVCIVKKRFQNSELGLYFISHNFCMEYPNGVLCCLTCQPEILYGNFDQSTNIVSRLGRVAESVGFGGNPPEPDILEMPQIGSLTSWESRLEFVLWFFGAISNWISHERRVFFVLSIFSTGHGLGMSEWVIPVLRSHFSEIHSFNTLQFLPLPSAEASLLPLYAHVLPINVVQRVLLYSR